jgi:uncharacterized protein
VGVPCPGCHREYDVTLFEFGRTIWCTCGARVGLAPRVRELSHSGEVALFADAMLGKLARWLRLLGIDCAWEPEIEDAELVRRAVQERRILLTRDRRLPAEWRISGVYVLHGDEPFEQVREVLQHFDLGRAVRLFTRCSECNVPLVDAEPEQVAGRVPARVAAEQRAFRTCPRCGRVYWEGSHTDRIRRRAERLLAPPGG